MLTGFSGNGSQYVVMLETLRELRKDPIVFSMITHKSITYGTYETPEKVKVTAAFLRKVFTDCDLVVSIHIHDCGKRIILVGSTTVSNATQVIDAVHKRLQENRRKLLK